MLCASVVCRVRMRASRGISRSSGLLAKGHGVAEVSRMTSFGPRWIDLPLRNFSSIDQSPAHCRTDTMKKKRFTEDVARQSGWKRGSEQEDQFGGRGEEMIVAPRQ